VVIDDVRLLLPILALARLLSVSSTDSVRLEDDAFDVISTELGDTEADSLVEEDDEDDDDEDDDVIDDDDIIVWLAPSRDCSAVVLCPSILLGLTEA
jgi:hypothetical protein